MISISISKHKGIDVTKLFGLKIGGRRCRNKEANFTRSLDQGARGLAKEDTCSPKILFNKRKIKMITPREVSLKWLRK